MDTDLDSDDLMPALEPLEDSDDDEDGEFSFDGASASVGSIFGEEDWFSEPEEVSGDTKIDISEETYDRRSNSGQEENDASEEALVTDGPSKSGQYSFVQAELYDSGCT